MSATLAMLSFQPMELLMIGGIALLIFGGRLPQTMRNLGKSVTEFRRGMKEGETEEQAEDAAGGAKPQLVDKNEKKESAEVLKK
jgi:sec-independent protein translocase protein TatA